MVYKYEFRVGDMVKCKQQTFLLNYGEIYKVVETFKGQVTIVEDENGLMAFANTSRFEPVQRVMKTQEIT